MPAKNKVDWRLQLKFWGVRGSTATPTAGNLGYGGNTTCLEIRSRGGQRIIVDAGTGAFNLGRCLMQESSGQSLDLHLFLTHFHWDHIQGLPFFAPMLNRGHKVTFYSFPAADEIRRRLHSQMSSPFFTLDFESARADRQFVQIKDAAIQCGDLSVTAFPLHHPQGACGYRIECDGAAIVVATDVEHGNAELDALLLEQSRGAELLVYDAQYTPNEYESRQGWGHSTYAAAARLAKDAQVGNLALFHHDPTHDDHTIDGMVEQAKLLFGNVSAAREQCTITL